MFIYNELLRKRQKNSSINVAVVGAGWFGAGLVKELSRWPGMVPRIIINRTAERAVEAYLQAGISKEKIKVVDSLKGLNQGISNGDYLVSNNLDIINDAENIAVVFEATGDILAGVKAALLSIDKGLHFITVNAEMDATVGHILNRYAKEKKLVYSNSDGDQPGILARMIDEVKLLGFKVVVAGNCKNFLDCHQTPEGVMPWVRPGHSPRMVSATADGSKQAFELAVLANATGLVPDIRGMHGPITTKATMVEDFLKVISQEGVVDYALGIKGINEAAGVFVIGKRTEDFVIKDMEYLKKGNGPYYLFFRGHHLCYFEAPTSIVDAVLFNVATIAPKIKAAEVVTIAKKDLTSGEKLDGIGGYTVYGLIERAEIAQKENLLPLGLAEYAVLSCKVKKDMPITYAMVDFPEDNLVLRLRRQQDEINPKNNLQG